MTSLDRRIAVAAATLAGALAVQQLVERYLVGADALHSLLDLNPAPAVVALAVAALRLATWVVLPARLGAAVVARILARHRPPTPPPG
jgi:hypothetical protein